MAFQSRKKFCYFKENGITDIDYKDVKLLRRFVNDQGKIMPRRITGSSAKMHRKLVRAIKRSRSIALMPYVENSAE
ncbi:MAG: 30S ribosomal protein S18 [Candidatus Marinimicrobia bacterium]|jgi:small subunit ribosomal protein S18|nr:30S ribosomal protein S18 [Candidatus Neomarinimicrobiota bacterium]MBT3518855.1 30S ribosomal protein S18 [Candidatus Neomarinimicrobiota bacterium]MBT4555515.1 30S ribosomal protein S18 [Candidatus Neomarinimicrobiota bacterium]MBT4753128.1 30S ribosomal protein S18 [Candidatus Neomarinimicrobiota bacterium]MBT5114506.1 30S ribosomal protein S18 [Candidatus Neomarinimicrobiota bacterium]|tara:strand:+ start:5171 stop:5398 length:228 start_codon:yes stop_codon:yes gene_type:complete